MEIVDETVIGTASTGVHARKACGVERRVAGFGSESQGCVIYGGWRPRTGRRWNSRYRGFKLHLGIAGLHAGGVDGKFDECQNAVGVCIEVRGHMTVLFYRQHPAILQNPRETGHA